MIKPKNKPSKSTKGTFLVQFLKMLKTATIWGIILIALTAGASWVLGTTLTDNLTAYYNLDNNNFDSSLSPTYTLTNISTTNVTGIINSARFLAGTPKDIMFNNSLSQTLNNATGFSISMWLKVNATSTRNIIYDCNTSSFCKIVLTANGGPLDFILTDSAGGSYTAQATAPYNDQYSHIVLTYGPYNTTNNTMAIWVNNVSGTPRFPGVNLRTSPANSNFSFGTKITGNSYQGSIDEVAIYVNKTLTAGEIGVLYQKGLGLAYPFTGGTFDSYCFIVKDMFYNTNITNVSINLTGATNYILTTNTTIPYCTYINSGLYNLLVGKAGYAVYSSTLTVVPSALGQQTIYLASNPTSVTIYAQNIYGQYLVGATINVSRESDGALIYSKVTDTTGGAAFILDSNQAYTVSVSAANYQTFNGVFQVTTTTMIVILGQNSTAIPDYYTGIQIATVPQSGTFLQNNTNYQFNSTYTNLYWNITTCNMTILDENNTQINATSYTTCNFANGTGSINAYTNNKSTFQLLNTFTINDNGTIATIMYKNTYTIKYTYEGDFSIMHGIRDFKNFNGSGFGDAERIFIVFIIIFSIVISAARASVNKYVSSSGLLWLIASLVVAASAMDLVHLQYIPGTSLIAQATAQWGLALVVVSLAIFTTVANIRSGGEQ